ncbi:hypothetical protein AXK60_09150 [Tsukamurella pseudospumae]|uniref:Uncharacterized protein n=2 Tax=Tsukamurella pseudospumae TaxID=239498 RepID=A0A138AEH8_9ACTN|nr:hypothetical protein AXK60_09150 [Tsukamurella pseudospumae]
MAAVHEQVLGLTRKGLSEDTFAVQLAVSSSLDRLVEAVDAALGYTEHPPTALHHADRVVLVDRSGAEPVESTFPIADWRREGPRILRQALEKWAEEGGRVRLSGSLLSGRATLFGATQTYTAYAWYAADENGAIHPALEVSKGAK